MHTLFIFDDSKSSLGQVVAAVKRAWDGQTIKIRPFLLTPGPNKSLGEIAQELIRIHQPKILILGPGFSFPEMLCPGRQLLLWLRSNRSEIQVAIWTFRELNEWAFREKYSEFEYIYRLSLRQKNKIAEFVRSCLETLGMATTSPSAS